ncbi:MAG TPA: histidine kinase [Candidatus Acidoferrum sp.]|nr:histidine kinase [Candidatus Acidoferrum sp.]
MMPSRQRLTAIAIAYLWSISVWLAFAPLLAGQDKLRLLERGLHTPYWDIVLVHSAWLLTSALLTPPIFWIVLRYPLSKEAGLRRVFAYVVGAVCYVIVSVCLRWLLLPDWNTDTQQFTARSLHGLRSDAYLFAFQIWDYFVINIGAHAYRYFTRVRDQELERAELQQALAASELQALKSQLHPHFLFNTLQGISALTDTDNRRAKAMVLKLSNLLRTALRHDSVDLVTLEEELKFVEDYLGLEKIRLEDRLELRWNIQPETREMLVPQLIMQPLVENAIVHGVACRREGGWIEISSRREGNILEVRIRNCVGAKQQEGIGLGLRNTRARLKHLYSDEASCSFDADGSGAAAATLLLPAIGSQSQAEKAQGLHAHIADGRN